MKKALASYLVRPLVQQARRMMAFRLVWTSKLCRDTQSIWPNMRYFQKAACDLLQEFPGVEFFLSSITATTSVGKVKSVNPGLAFWVAIDTRTGHESQVYLTMRNSRLGAELKILTHKSVPSEVDLQVHYLSIVLKDYGPGFVETKVASTLGPGEQYLRDRVYMRAAQPDADYLQKLLLAQEALCNLGLQMHVETF